MIQIQREATPATIWARFTQPGLHRWPDAPSGRAYLAHPHRHMFSVQVSLDVDHDDHEVEFHDLRDAAATAFRGLAIGPAAGALPDFGPQSCEALARRLASILADRFDRLVAVAVSEDDEFGAEISVGPEFET